AALVASMFLGPIVDRITRRLARARVNRALVLEEQTISDAPIELRRQLTVQSMAASIEGEAWPLARSAAFATVSWLMIFGALTGGFGDTVGKALSYLVTHGGVAMILMVLAAYLHGRAIIDARKVKHRGLIVLGMLAAMIVPVFTAGFDVVQSVAIGVS